MNQMSTGELSSAQTQPWTLPLFITRQSKYLWGVVFTIIAVFLYVTSNQFPIFTPRLLPMSWVDVAVPFMPDTVWIYVSEWIFFWVAYVICRDMENVNKYLYAFFALQLSSVMIFWVWPTTYPRDQFPLPEDLNAATYYVFSNLRSADAPTNCCPSLHVSSDYLTTFLFLNEQKRKFPFFFIWGTLIGLSTLTTKQHYIIDVIAGFLMAIIVYWIFFHLIQYRPAIWPSRRRR
jgi:membrane-associated phospholipid phosphatase